MPTTTILHRRTSGHAPDVKASVRSQLCTCTPRVDEHDLPATSSAVQGQSSQPAPRPGQSASGGERCRPARGDANQHVGACRGSVEDAAGSLKPSARFTPTSRASLGSCRRSHRVRSRTRRRCLSPAGATSSVLQAESLDGPGLLRTEVEYLLRPGSASPVRDGMGGGVGAVWHPKAVRRTHIDAGSFQGGGRSSSGTRRRRRPAELRRLRRRTSRSIPPTARCGSTFRWTGRHGRHEGRPELLEHGARSR